MLQNEKTNQPLLSNVHEHWPINRYQTTHPSFKSPNRLCEFWSLLGTKAFNVFFDLLVQLTLHPFNDGVKKKHRINNLRPWCNLGLTNIRWSVMAEKTCIGRKCNDRKQIQYLFKEICLLPWISSLWHSILCFLVGLARLEFSMCSSMLALLGYHLNRWV